MIEYILIGVDILIVVIMIGIMKQLNNMKVPPYYDDGKWVIHSTGSKVIKYELPEEPETTAFKETIKKIHENTNDKKA